MIKQILSKLPKKVPKSDSSDSARSDSSNTTSFGNVFQCTNVGSTISSKLNVVKRVSSVVFPASMSAGVEAVDPCLSFKDVSNTQKQSLFISKLNLCCKVYDMSDPDKNSTEQDLKRQTLLELVDFVSSGSVKFTEPAIAALCKMCAANLFRVFPPKFRTSTTGGETEDEEPMFDPAWSHLQVVYDLLLQFINYNSLDVKLAKVHIDHAFILRLLDLFDSEDPRERDCLKTILHRIYGKFMVHRPFIRKSVSNIIYRFVFETERHNGIAELLEIFGSVISGFALPLKEEHKIFLYKDQRLASTVIKGLLKYWPVTNSQKELMLISELEEILEMTSMAEFQKIMVPLFRRMACCLNSSHYQIRFFGSFHLTSSKLILTREETWCILVSCYREVYPKRVYMILVAERAHLLWNNEHILNLITQNRQVILPLVFSAIVHNAESHWNQAVLNLTQNIRKMLSQMDEELVDACQRRIEEEDSSASAAAEKRRLTWERLEAAAAATVTATSSVQYEGGGDVLVPVKSATCSVAC
uniref:Serine/threonine protein phosphatase 2A regulatory subunit n=1 Tax=Cajanus cajan TaxID=3821 RepID=A0A151SLD1_CAJCA|nr:Serine/threonine protein phosphatase 2A 57 kDa regulatory subunit B' iota isoform [Cajanus cajan]